MAEQRKREKDRRPLEDMEQGQEEELPVDPSILDVPDSEEEAPSGGESNRKGAGKPLVTRKPKESSSIPPSFSRPSRVNSELSRALTGTRLSSYGSCNDVFNDIGGHRSPAIGSVGSTGYNETFIQGVTGEGTDSFPGGLWLGRHGCGQ